MNELAPVSVLRKYGHLTASTVTAQAEELCDLLGIQSLEDEPPWDAAARRHNGTDPITPVQRGWLACARKKAREVVVDCKFDRADLERLASTLTGRVLEPSNIRALPALFADVGVRLVHVPAFSGSRLDGASFLLDGDPCRPVIALSGRGKRLDKVLFTLLHEAAHVTQGHLEAVEFLIDEDGRDNGDLEAQADETAARWCLPLVSTPPAVIDRSWIDAEAHRQGVHPIIVVGRLQHSGQLAWSTSLGTGAPSVTDHLAAW